MSKPRSKGLRPEREKFYRRDTNRSREGELDMGLENLGQPTERLQGRFEVERPRIRGSPEGRVEREGNDSKSQASGTPLRDFRGIRGLATLGSEPPRRGK